MGRYTSIHTDMWSDSEVEELTPMGKLLYFYLLTSPFSNSAGYYRLPVKQIACDLGLTKKEILPELTDQDKLWKYSENTQQVLLPNYLKYNKAKSPSQLKALNAHVMTLETCRLHIDFFFEVYKHIGPEAVKKFDESLLKYLRVTCKQYNDQNALVVSTVFA